MLAPSNSIKTATFKLGVVSFDVTLHSAAADDKETKLSNLCTSGHPASTVRMKLQCPICSAEGGFEKGQKQGNEWVIVPPEVIEKTKEAAKPASEVIDLSVHEATDLATLIPSGKSYYLKASNAAKGPYALIVELLRNRPDLGLVARFALRTSVSVFRIMATEDGVLVLQQTIEPRLIRERPVMDGVANDKELAMLVQFADMLKTQFDPSIYDSEKAKILAEHAATATPVAGVVTEEGGTSGGEVVSLTEKLAAALKAGNNSDSGDKKRPARKTAAKRAPARSVG